MTIGSRRFVLATATVLPGSNSNVCEADASELCCNYLLHKSFGVLVGTAAVWQTLLPALRFGILHGHQAAFKAIKHSQN